MKTHELIQALSSDLKPQKRLPALKVFLGYWTAGVVALFAVIFSTWLSLRSDWHDKLHDPRFFAESALWFLVAFSAAVMVYRSTIPSLLKKSDQKWAAIPLLLIGALWAAKFHAATLGTEFQSEMDLYRGRCGPIILAIGLLSGAGLFAWIRRAAPTRLGVTGLWAALSSASLGSLAMQAVCTHENALHLWIWHVLPVIGMTLAGAFIAERILWWRGTPLQSTV